MKETDQLNSLLKEWHAPVPPAALDTRVRAAYRQQVQRQPVWRRIWSTRVTVPVPVLVALLLIALWLQFRPRPQAVQPAVPPGYMTRIESAGFKPLPNGATRVIRSTQVVQ